ncbi:hypothetical protein HPP92_023737 [Vanilla planifolia]|uniref:Cell wall hydroxyproline-rich glycoprotein n=1 Tax=Vanilla planifolia TaxID=51239 RepID=A0A835PNJ3_VANPL|nr:hypothetical protein HPP92_024079 [Vanilla planifolia]KAG0455949.1 hypothetical protein HPP92_023737 [Vanilla planifolia]
MKSGTLQLFSLFLLVFLFAAAVSRADGFSGRGLNEAEKLSIRQRQLLYYRDEFGDRGEKAWKKAIVSDPLNVTGSWVGSNVCNYKGVYCAPLPSNKSLIVVAGIDLNHDDIAGFLPEELGLLTDLALFHVNSNRFCGTIPHRFDRLRLLFELDLSNNRFAGKFPDVVLRLPSLRFLDLRFNEFEGTVPSELFDKNLDAIFINSNRFRFNIPNNIGNSPVSVIVLANNQFGGCLPASIGNMSKTLNEIILMNNGLKSCVPKEFDS